MFSCGVNIISLNLYYLILILIFDIDIKKNINWNSKIKLSLQPPHPQGVPPMYYQQPSAVVQAVSQQAQTPHAQSAAVQAPQVPPTAAQQHQLNMSGF